LQLFIFYTIFLHAHPQGSNRRPEKFCLYEFGAGTGVIGIYDSYTKAEGHRLNSECPLFCFPFFASRKMFAQITEQAL
jgi:hypothetical protein